MAEQRHIDEQLGYLKDKSDAELIAVQGEFKHFAAQHIAATQILYARQQESQVKDRILQEGMNRKTFWVLLLTVGIFILTVFMVFLMIT